MKFFSNKTLGKEPVDRFAEEETRFLAKDVDDLSSDDGSIYVRKSKRNIDLNTAVRGVVYGTFIISYALLLYAHILSSKPLVPPWVHGSEGIYSDDAPLETHLQILTKAGFHTGPPNPWEGRPNEQNEKEWQDLMRVGMIAISEEENARLPLGGTAQVRNASGLVPGQYVVQTQVSHQIHCLKRLRELIWLAEKGEAEEWQFGHASHCIDFLRQALMCHGDLTPIYQDWVEEAHRFRGVQENLMQCRSWEAIVAWSTKRNTTGMRIDGDHGKNAPHNSPPAIPTGAPDSRKL